MSKAHIKSGDEVVVLSGSESGKRGKVMQVLRKDGRAIIEGINLRKKHQKKTKDNPQGSIIEREAPLHMSNLMRADRYEERRAGQKGSKEQKA